MAAVHCAAPAPQPPARARGFTLIEVLVALAIVAIGMAAVLGALNSSADTVSYLRDKTFAQWVALNQIANLRISGQLQAPGNSDGDTDFAGRTWHWRQEVTATQVPGVVRIDVKVRPKDVKTDDEDSGWFTTVSGIQGDAVGSPNGYLPDWGTQMLPGSVAQPGIGTRGTIGAPGTLGAPGSLGPTTPGGTGTLGSGTLGAPPLPGDIPTITGPPQPITPDGSQ
jgi:general secretion pathway protein I